jgi:anti-anti-sigma factor
LDSGKSFELERRTGYARLVLSPNLNAFHWADVERSAAEILTAIETTKASAVIVDLTPLDYLGSAQLTLLVRVWKAIKAGGGRMVVLSNAPVVREVLNTAGLGALWEFADSLPAAYETIGLQPDGRPRMSMIWPTIGLVALTGALAGFCATQLKAGGLDARLSLIVQLCCSAVALPSGLWTMIRGSGARRGLGIGMVLASALLAAVEFLQAPR